MKLLGDYSRYDVGKLVRIHDADIGVVDVRVMKYAKSDVGEQPWAVSLEIGNKRDNLAVSQTDLERRQQINDTYSQGSTNVDSYPYQDNCDAQHPAVIRFYLDEDLINVNTLDLTLETSNFRAYSRAIEGGGAVVSSTSAGGAVVKSTSSGGGVVRVVAPTTQSVTISGQAVKPVITLSGAGTNVRVAANGRAFTLASLGGATWIVDCESETVTRNGVARFDALNGDFIELLPGNNVLSIAGSGLNFDFIVKARDIFL